MQKCEWAEVTAIASRTLASAEEAARKLNIPKAYGSYEELLADPQIDAIYNPLPNQLHVPWTIKAAEASKHVLCEKPLSMTVAEAKTLVAVQARTGVKIGDASHRKAGQIADLDAFGAGDRQRQSADGCRLVDDEQHVAVRLQLADNGAQSGLVLRQCPVEHDLAGDVQRDCVMLDLADVDAHEHIDRHGLLHVDHPTAFEVKEWSTQHSGKPRHPRYGGLR